MPSTALDLVRLNLVDVMFFVRMKKCEAMAEHAVGERGDCNTRGTTDLNLLLDQFQVFHEVTLSR